MHYKALPFVNKQVLTIMRHSVLLSNQLLCAFIVFSCFFTLAYSSIRCQECFVTWQFNWGGLHETNPWFVHLAFLRHVCKLKKAIYGPKEAPHAWFHHFSSFLLSRGFVCSHVDPLMFIARTESHILVLHPYVDDIVLIGNYEGMLHKFITPLLQQFAILQYLFRYSGGSIALRNFLESAEICTWYSP